MLKLSGAWLYGLYSVPQGSGLSRLRSSCCGQQQIDGSKNAGKLLAILIAMAMQRYDTGHIDQWSTSGASLEATGCHHWPIAWVVLPRRPPWSTNLNETHKTLTKQSF